MLTTSRDVGAYVSEPAIELLEIPAFSGEVPPSILSTFFSAVTKVKNRQLLEARKEIDTLISANPVLAKQSAYWCFRIDMELYSGCTSAAHGVLAEAFLQNPEPREMLVEKAHSMKITDPPRSGVFSSPVQHTVKPSFSRSPIYEKLQLLASHTTPQDLAEGLEKSELSLHESQTTLYTSIVGNPIPQPLCGIQRELPEKTLEPAQKLDEPSDGHTTYLDDDTLRLSALK